MNAMLFASRLLVPVLVFLLTEPRCIIGDSGCDGHIAHIYLSYTQNNGTIYSPGYPNNYGNHEDCAWRILAPPGQKLLIYFTEFETETTNRHCWRDTVNIFDGRGTLAPRLSKSCGYSLPAPVYSSGEHMLVRFTSDRSYTAKGFVAHYRALNSSSGCPEIIPGASAGVIYSPHFPWNYPKGISCEWLITVKRSMVLNFTIFDLKPSRRSGYCDDYVSVRDQNNQEIGKYCGSQIPSSITFNREGNITVRFYSHYTDEKYEKYSGFMAFYDLTGRSNGLPTLFPYSPIYICTGADSQTDLFVESLSSVFIGSNPDFDNCTFKIITTKGHILELRFKTMSIVGSSTCSMGHVKVRDGSSATSPLLGTYCSAANYQDGVTTKGNSMFVVFNAHFGGDGFTATISSKRGSNSSKTVIAVICSLLGVVVIGLLILYFYCKKRKSSQEIQPRRTELQLTSSVPAASEGSPAQLSSDLPPAYSSVMANEPPPYSSVEAAAPLPTSSAATMPSRPTNT